MTDFINHVDESDKSVSQLIKDLTGGVGVDYCFECTGVPNFTKEALEATKLEIQLDELLTHEVQLSDIGRAFQLM
ncbi:hypothetical protein L484_010013 [Morus notabilis]|uniref:Alcohol dehydrogenase-like C-terminal domain-containing protein n=1 Tax=Morus notabilis TaxID=981085 RepID=W9R1L9_9ROSA|nr:hypothetical protein L484_010013 [Morus notabilis]